MRAIVWAHPRSRSTAFERAFIERDDFVVLHEPTTKYRYFGESVGDILAAMSGKSTLMQSSLLADVRYTPKNPKHAIVKDMPYCALEFLNDEFLGTFDHHIILVRSPAASLRSFYTVNPDFEENEAGYPELLALAKHLKNKLGRRIFIIEADEFAKNPKLTLQECCNYLGISYDRRMVNWSQRSEIPAWDIWSNFHKEALSTTSVKCTSSSSSCGSLPEACQTLIRKMEPVYHEILELSG